MAESFNKKERNKKRQKRKREKAEKREQKKLNKEKPIEFMYVGADGNLTTEKPDLSLKEEIDAEDIEIGIPKKGKSDESKFTKLGFVKFFNTEKGYGFIVGKETNESYFVHADNLTVKIKDGDNVSFEIGKGPKGPIALEVKLV